MPVSIALDEKHQSPRTSPSVWLSVLGLSAVVHAAAFVSHGDSSASSPANGTPSTEVQIETSPSPDSWPPAPDTKFPQRVTQPPLQAVTANRKSTSDRSLARAPVVMHETPAQAAPAETAIDDTPRFAIAIGMATTASGSVSAPSDGAARSTDEGPLAEQTVDSPARLVHGGAPSYPAQARADRVEADVLLDIVVSTSGTVTSARVVRPSGHGLDEAAVAAAHQFRFAPATKAGHAVPVRMRWTMEFRLW